MSYQLFHGDCLETMSLLEEHGIDAIITDIPYGTTSCSWDSVIPLDEMWKQVKRVLNSGGVFITTASQPFTSVLVMSNPDWLKHELIWHKSNPSNIALAQICPLKYHENILVFCGGKHTYNKQMIPRMESGTKVISDYKQRGTTFKHGATEHHSKTETTEYTADRYDIGLKNPGSVLWFKSERCHPRLHPTQKPVPLYEWLIRTYTNSDGLVVDIAMGSGTTGVACVRTGRNFIGIEKEQKYFEIAKQRIEQAQPTLL